MIYVHIALTDIVGSVWIHPGCVQSHIRFHGNRLRWTWQWVTIHLTELFKSCWSFLFCLSFQTEICVNGPMHSPSLLEQKPLHLHSCTWSFRHRFGKSSVQSYRTHACTQAPLYICVRLNPAKRHFPSALLKSNPAALAAGNMFQLEGARGQLVV